jgi:hypothetical protein
MGAPFPVLAILFSTTAVGAMLTGPRCPYANLWLKHGPEKAAEVSKSEAFGRGGTWIVHEGHDFTIISAFVSLPVLGFAQMLVRAC